MTNNDIVSSTETISNVSAEGPQSANVPNLRFPQYTSEWRKNRLETLVKMSKGYGITKDQLSVEGQPCILYGELYTTYKNEVISEVKSKTDIDTKGLVYSQANDVIIPSSGETPEDIATACCVMLDDILLGGDLNILRPYNDNGCFLSYQLNGRRKYDIARVAQGASIVHLHNEHLRSLNIFTPESLDEQEKIVSLLALIDERIDTQSKIIEELELLKSTISNTLFDRPSIEEKRLDTYYSKGKAGGTPTFTKKEYYGGDIPFLSISDMTEQGKYLYYTDKSLTEIGLKNSAAWIVPTNSLILSMYASVGLVAINKVPISTSQAMFSMVIKDSFELEYLYYFLSYFKEKKLHRLLETGTQSNINADMVRNIMIADFGYAENRKIVKILKTYDKKIQIEKELFFSLSFRKNVIIYRKNEGDSI